MKGWDLVAEKEEEVDVFALSPPIYLITLPLMLLPMLPPSLFRVGTGQFSELVH
jgi:hypothetical protein